MRAQVAGLREMAEAAGLRVQFVGSALGLDSPQVWPNAEPVRRAAFKLGFRKSMAIGAAIHECGVARMGSLSGRRPDLTNYGVIGFGRVSTPGARLSTWSAISSRANLLHCARGVRLPVPSLS